MKFQIPQLAYKQRENLFTNTDDDLLLFFCLTLYSNKALARLPSGTITFIIYVSFLSDPHCFARLKLRHKRINL